MSDKINVLIGDNSMEYGVACADILRRQGMFVYTRPKNGAAMFETIKSKMPDIVISDSVLPDMNAVELIEKVNALGIKKIIFIITSPFDDPFTEQHILRNSTAKFLLKPFDINALGQMIINAFDELQRNEQNVVSKIAAVFELLGISEKQKGCKYLKAAIMEVLENVILLMNITKLLYPLLAKKFNTNSASVERAIRHTIKTAWEKKSPDEFYACFGYDMAFSPNRPTNAEFIAMAADKARMDNSGSRETEKVL